MANTVNNREVILDTMLLITKEGKHSHIALRGVLDKYQYLEKKERAFITRVVNGTLERMIELDYVISLFINLKINKLKPVIRAILETGVFQILYMDGIPDSAVCNEAVKLANQRGFRNLKGFVNGVLRNVARKKEEISYPNLAVRYSLPEWIVKMWKESYTEQEIEVMGAYFLAEKPFSIRFDPERIQKEQLIKLLKEEEIESEEIPGYSDALYLKNIDYLGKLKSFQEGLFYVQDISSMEVGRWAQPQNGDYCIDLCGAPGGKTIHLSQLLKGSGMVDCRDVSEYKVDLILENLKKSHIDNVKVKVFDARLLDEDIIDKGDIVIADLPCSGLGVLNRKPDIKYHLTEEGLVSLVELQREILKNARKYVKPGGKLIYSTCTVNKKENEENTSWFLENNSDFKLIREKQRIPGVDMGDGFYLAQFQKEKHDED